MITTRFRLLTVLIILPVSLISFPVNIQTVSSHQVAQEWDITTEFNGAEVVIMKHDGIYDGYNLFMLLITNRTSLERYFYLMIVDMEGNIILNDYVGEGIFIADCPAEFIDPTTILTATPDGAVLYNLIDGNKTLLNFEGHHELEFNPNNNTFFTFHYNPIEIDGTEYLFDFIQEFDHNGNLVWSFDTSNIISPSQFCPYGDMLLGLPDVTHSNTIFYNPDEDTILYNARNVNTFYLIDHSSGEIIWSLGEYGDFTLLDKNGNEKETLFYHAHTIEQVDDNVFILMDNDLHNQTDEFNYIPRIMEITIDTNSMTAQTSRVYAAPREYFSPIFGDADRLPNGNRLGVFGFHVNELSYGPRVVEVNNEGERVWEMTLLNNDDFFYGIYRTERFRHLPILSSPEDITITDNQSVKVEWSAWYNYRPKRNIVGYYSLYLDGTRTSSGLLTYDKYWRPVDLGFDLGILSDGEHNATLVLEDAIGKRLTRNSLSIVVQSTQLPSYSLESLFLALGVAGAVIIIVLFLPIRRKSIKD